MMNKAKLSIVIHTEEEFDWSGGFKATNNQVSHAEALFDMCKDMLDVGCCITFALDYAFVTSQQGVEFIQRIKHGYASQIEFGAHLHPWVNPPFFDPKDEYIDEHKSYPGNLDKAIEREKLTILTDTIYEVTGQRPTTYLAGRYGVGENTYSILKELGYKVDVSVSPFADFRHQFGPDFSQHTNASFDQNGIRCIPHSTGFVSAINAFSDWLNKDAANLDKLNNNIVGKVILKLLGVKKVRLSPEGFNQVEMIKLSDSLTRIGIDWLVYSFHSSSSAVKGSPYSDTPEQNEAFKQHNLNTLRLLQKSKHCVVF